MIKDDAIICVAEDNSARLVVMQNIGGWVEQAQLDYDSIAEHEFDVTPGLYYANCKASQCCGSYCGGGNCCGDCGEIEWLIGSPIYTLGANNESERADEMCEALELCVNLFGGGSLFAHKHRAIAKAQAAITKYKEAQNG